MLPPLLLCVTLSAAASGAGGAGRQDRARDLRSRGRARGRRQRRGGALASVGRRRRGPGDADIQNRLGEALERIGALDAAIDAYSARCSRPPGLRPDDEQPGRRARQGRPRRRRRPPRARRGSPPRPPTPTGSSRWRWPSRTTTSTPRCSRCAQVIARRRTHALAHYNLALLLKRVDWHRRRGRRGARAAPSTAAPEAHLALGTLYFQQGATSTARRPRSRPPSPPQPRSVEGWLQLGTVRQGARRPRARRRRPAPCDRAAPRARGARTRRWRPSSAAGVTTRAGAGAHPPKRSAGVRTSGASARPSSITTVGIARLDAGDTDAAIERFRAAIVVADGYAPAHYHLGRALLQSGRATDARRAFDEGAAAQSEPRVPR